MKLEAIEKLTPALTAADITHSNDGRASVKDLRCPRCGGGSIAVVGAEGATGRSFMALLIGPFIYKWIYSNTLATPWSICYKCRRCSHNFIGEPAQACSEEILSEPCLIRFERVSGFVGAFMPQIVHLNGVKVTPVKNGQTITFPTHVRHNVVFVTDHFGSVFANPHTFEAKPGESVALRFDRKFLTSESGINY